MNKLREGDIVRLVNGKNRLTVIAVQDHHAEAAYDRNGLYGHRLVSEYKRTCCNSTSTYDRRRFDDGYRSFSKTKIRPMSDFVPYDTTETPTHKSESIMTAKLYKTIDGDYGTLLTKDSTGNFVLELKGNKGVKAYAENTLEEVAPYTFSVRGMKPGNVYTCAYTGVSGCTAVGDILLSDTGNVYRVTGIDTKDADPKGEFKGVRLTSTPFGA